MLDRYELKINFQASMIQMEKLSLHCWKDI